MKYKKTWILIFKSKNQLYMNKTLQIILVVIIIKEKI